MHCPLSHTHTRTHGLSHGLCHMPGAAGVLGAFRLLATLAAKDKSLQLGAPLCVQPTHVCWQCSLLWAKGQPEPLRHTEF